MNTLVTEKLFKQPFLSQFILVPSLLPFTDNELRRLDLDLDQYGQLFLNPDVEKNLISKNELLASFAISKAEKSALTLPEAQNVYDIIVQNEDYSFISEKLKNRQKLTQKDHDKLEFYNIAKAFRNYNKNPIQLKEVTPEYIKDLHKQLTQGLDIFENYLPEFNVYKSGYWRDNDNIRVGTYLPAPYAQIKPSIIELLQWIKQRPAISSVGIFHTALYALHPFNNGNKRVARVLEHIFLRNLGTNKKNLYSTSYYYHKERERYYKYLLFSLERKNLNQFVSFFQEAFVLSIISVVKTSLETKRSEFLLKRDTVDQVRTILKPLIKRREVQFKNLFKYVDKKMARQTFVNYLQQATNEGIVIKRDAGRTTYYSLNVSLLEEEIFHNLLKIAKVKLSFIPDDIKLV